MTATFKRGLVRLLPWLFLWGVFIAFGVWVRRVQPWESSLHEVIELHGLDYRRYSQLLGNWHMIFYAAFRHPLYGWLMAPVIGIGARFQSLGTWPYWIWLITFFSGVMTGAHALIYWLLRRVSLDRVSAASVTVLFASFAASYFLAACPESFNISCFLALVTIHFALYVHRHAATISRRMEWAGWCLLTVFTGGITCTQAVKTFLAYLVTRRPSGRRIAGVALALLGAAGLVAVIFAVRLYVRVGADAYAREFAAALGNISGYFAGGGQSLAHCLGRIYVFFTEPLVTRGAPFSENVLPVRYGSVLGAMLAMAPLVAAALAAWVARRDFLVRLMLAMLCVDVAIHFVLFWGMDEAQIYAGHWYYTVPIFLGLGLLRLGVRARRWVALAILFCATCILAWNCGIIVENLESKNERSNEQYKSVDESGRRRSEESQVDGNRLGGVSGTHAGTEEALSRTLGRRWDAVSHAVCAAVRSRNP